MATATCNREIATGIARLYRVVLAGDGQEVNIRCDSEKEADKILNSIQEVLKKCSRYYFFLINNYMIGFTGHGFIVDADHMFLAILCEGVFEAPVVLWFAINGDKS